MERLTEQEHFNAIIKYFEENMPVAESELNYLSPYELLVAVILSAQCTDKRVNIITPPFFKRFPDPFSLANGTTEEIFELIKSCSYPNNKTKNIFEMAKVLTTSFNGIVPSEVEELQKLPGVGRKTANVIASVVYKKPVLAVDTHVFRVAARLGLSSNAKNPLQTEKQLTKHIPKEKIPIAHHWLILHGRYICVARKPKCTQCGLTSLCKYYQSLIIDNK